MGKAAGGMVSTLTPTAHCAQYVADCAEVVRCVVQDPARVPPLAVFRHLKTPASRRAWLAAAGVDVPSNQSEGTTDD